MAAIFIPPEPGDAIKLGSAGGVRLIFQDGSSIKTSDSGIQECSIKALCPDGANVFNYIPLAGATYQSVFGNAYLPADFKVDYTGGGATITYLKGKAAQIDLNFKRPDPTTTNQRKIYEDTVIRFISTGDFNGGSFSSVSSGGGGGSVVVIGTDVTIGVKKIGLPEPVVTVRYNSTSRPNYDRAYYALPNTPPTLGFPTVPSKITSSIGYYTGTSFTSPDIMGIDFQPDPSGWQLTEIKADPIAGADTTPGGGLGGGGLNPLFIIYNPGFYDITETWRMTYIQASAPFQLLASLS